MKKWLLFAGLIITAFFSVNAQTLDSMISVYADQLPQQKVHVHFDKDLYRAGESIWFKAYLFSGFSLAGNSRNFYAELINDRGTVLQRKVYPVIEAAAAGNFDLPDSLAAGNLIFRGYTTWMLNFDTAFIFQKSIAVVNKAGNPEKKLSEPAKTFSLQFFPEGGNLVSTLQSRVAFKANDSYGLPIPVKGNIVNSKGVIITTFSDMHDGMGVFALTPEANETYQANWTDPQGKQQTVTLPAAKAQGYVLKIDPAGNKRIFTISRTEEVPEGWKKVNIVALLGQERVYKAKATLEASKITSGTIP
ncbi:MAG TPA: hypothetical protein VF610_01620, partial [Segetibacter sp.]